MLFFSTLDSGLYKIYCNQNKSHEEFITFEKHLLLRIVRLCYKEAERLAFE